MRRTHTYSRQTVDAAEALGLSIARARREHRWTLADLAERAGISPITLRKVERGDPTVTLGTAFELATLLSVPLFGVAANELSSLVAWNRDKLALLPDRVRHPSSAVRDDF